MQDPAEAIPAVDLAACENEPTRIPGSIQPHGVLLCVSAADLVVLQASENAGLLCGRPADALPGEPLDERLPALAALVRDRGADRICADAPVLLGRIAPEGGEFHVLAHRSGDLLVLELEELAEPQQDVFGTLYRLVSASLAELQTAADVGAIAAVAARQVRAVTGFDRVLIYRFDEHWNGTVIAEDRNEALPSCLDLRFPASDIPREARELDRLNRQRMIPDADYRPVPVLPALNPLTGAPLDLGLSVLRGVSPVHLEHMRNMGTAASMSFPLLREGELWGLISCHNAAPRRAGFHQRAACELIGQIASLQIAAREHAADAAHRIELKSIETRLLAAMAAAERFTTGLTRNPDELLRLTGAEGAAILHEGGCERIGGTPPEAALRRLADWLGQKGIEEVFCTESLAEHLPDFEAHKDVASGLLAIPISRIHPSYVLWFRPEAVRTVEWGGDPRKPVDGAGPRPRRSFEMWKETVHRRSLPWRDSEVAAARDLRHAIVGIVLRKAEEMAALSDELMRSNRELEAFSYSVSHDLRAPFRHVVGYAELLREYDGDRLSERGRRYVETIIESAQSAGKLVDDLLSFSRVGRARLQPMPVDMNELVAEERRKLEADAQGRTVEWRIARLDPAFADPMMLRLAVGNLLSNALKYTRPRERAVIEVGCEAGDGETVYFVRDNGVGFDNTYANKLFGVFQRLHRIEEFEGTGIGLANVRRIMERHGGRVWATGEVGRGASFHFALPHSGRGA